MTKSQNEMICDVMEAIEQARKWAPLYRTVLRQTGSRDQAAEAVKWCVKQDEEMEQEAFKRAHRKP